MQKFPDFRVFLRALAATIDAENGPQKRDELLRTVGTRMSRLMPVGDVTSVAELEMEINELLSAAGWGCVKMTLREAERCLVISHTGLPRVGAKGEPSGLWLGAVLEGLIEGWMTQQPGADPALTVRRQGLLDDGSLELHYRRPAAAHGNRHDELRS